MKILLSAYACEPGKGSEPGVGWNWAIELAKLGHEVWVLTRTNNREHIEKTLIPEDYPHLHFIYCDLPAWCQKLKKKGPFIQLYYALWQWKAYQLAAQHHQKQAFNLVHHITFGVFRQASFMGNLGIPFIFGPVGGGEKAPWALRYRYSLNNHFTDSFRDLLNRIAQWDPWLQQTLTQATQILVKTPETKALIPHKHHTKVQQLIEIGVKAQTTCIRSAPNPSKGLKILYVGRLLYWKGLQLGIEAFAHCLKTHPNCSLTIVGSGPDESNWRSLCAELGIENEINWLGWIEQSKLNDLYQAHDVFLFPSLHDSSGNVVLEALSNGLPVICLDLGGPAMIVDESCGRIIQTTQKTAKQVINALSQTLIALAEDPASLTQLSRSALHRAASLSWASRVQAVYKNSST